MPTAAALASLRAADLHVAVNLNGHHWNAASESVRLELFDGAAAAVVVAAVQLCGGARDEHVYGIPGAVRRTSCWTRTPTSTASSPPPRRPSTPDAPERAQHAEGQLTTCPAPPRGRSCCSRHRRAPTPCRPDDALWCSLNQLPKLDPELFSSWLNALGRAAGMGGGGRTPRPTTARRRGSGCCASPPPPRLPPPAGGCGAPEPAGAPRAAATLSTVAYEAHLRRAAHCDLFVDSRLCNAHADCDGRALGGDAAAHTPRRDPDRARRRLAPRCRRLAAARRAVATALMRTGSSRWRAVAAEQPPGHRAWIVCTFIRSVRELLLCLNPLSLSTSSLGPRPHSSTALPSVRSFSKNSVRSSVYVTSGSRRPSVELL